MNWDERRLKILEELKAQGVDPYPPKFQLTHTIKELRELASKFPEKSREPFVNDVSTAGRIANVRVHGKASFIDIFDDGERIQLYLRVNELGQKYEWTLKYVDRGDIVGVRGDLFYTMKNELTLLVRDLKLLTKALLDPPDWSSLGVEFRYAHRYVDFLYNASARKAMELRFRLIAEIRDFLKAAGFIEVDTPILQPVYGGALARPFKSHVNYLNEDWYLRISLELYLKRLVVGGFDKVFEIGKVFRNEDIDVTHNPEFTLLELYWAYADYNDIMRLTEEMIRTVLKKITGEHIITAPVSKAQLDLDASFRKVTMYEALSEQLGVNVESLSDEQLKEIVNKNGLVPRGGMYLRGLMIEKLFDKFVTPKLVEPTFVLDYPIETTPLCKPHRSKPGLVERFELFVDGVEVANAYSELNDPVLQAKLFQDEQEMMRRGDVEAHPYDKDFIRALSYGMPPTGGLGVGIDRLVMLATGNMSIKEVIPFPMVSSRTINE
ncbi:lysine--tRNA ligase [Sulfodiicoccus acidiphilus]|uniref:Lysine--tRNA ligase n=1 Tax=Sulfodiicoccus acidiphilus TaxID=1670455 RepID=A0A348B709_9CREN|nr:lysine--tRNA ligase [Sulfodiicoccus acidiphilus]BBD73961.1 lysine--tRNA ligase [Sulfodiicoccus acidiphilus]GGU02765.1 lysine--tRNA ligase [Sulfodiicoccus acidiphilus]